MDLHSSLREIKGVGEKTEQLFQKIGVYTLGDILLHFPRTYQEYPQPEDPDRGCLRFPSYPSHLS